MPQSLKQRLVGALVLCALAVLVLPVLFDRPPAESDFTLVVPPAPVVPETPTFVDQVGPDATPLPDQALLPEGQEQVVDASAQAEVLEEAELSAPASEVQLDQAGEAVAWTLQLGTFGDQANARRLVAELQQQGYHAYQRDFRQKDGRLLTRVYVGPLVARSELEQVAASLKQQRGLQGLILRYHP